MPSSSFRYRPADDACPSTFPIVVEATRVSISIFTDRKWHSLRPRLPCMLETISEPAGWHWHLCSSWWEGHHVFVLRVTMLCRTSERATACRPVFYLLIQRRSLEAPRHTAKIRIHTTRIIMTFGFLFDTSPLRRYPATCPSQM